MNVGESFNDEVRPNYVRFETRAVEDKRESLKQGHYVGIDVDYVMVTMPGGRDVFENTVERWLENEEIAVRNGRQDRKIVEYYKDAYKHYKEGKEIPVNGTAIRNCTAFSPAQMETIIRSGIRTIEDLAAVNDEGLRRLGMGGRELVSKAKSWLKTSTDTGQIALQNAELVKENENLKTTVESLEEKVNILMRKVESMDHDNYQVPRGTISVSDTMSEPAQFESDLSKQYEQKFGKKPHWKMKEETIRAKLEE